MKPARTRRLAAPLVLTLSAAPACKSAGDGARGGCEPPRCHMNPPPPPRPSATAAPPTEPLPVAAAPRACAETAGVRPCIRRDPGGACVLLEDHPCPAGAKCNPPGPSPIACP